MFYSLLSKTHTSVNRVEQQHKIGTASVQKWYLYKLHWSKNYLRMILIDACSRRFYDLIMKMINDDPLFLDNTVFSNEATFELTGNVNRHEDCRYWSNINPYWMRKKSYPAPTKS